MNSLAAGVILHPRKRAKALRVVDVADDADAVAVIELFSLSIFVALAHLTLPIQSSVGGFEDG